MIEKQKLMRIVLLFTLTCISISCYAYSDVKEVEKNQKVNNTKAIAAIDIKPKQVVIPNEQSTNYEPPVQKVSQPAPSPTMPSRGTTNRSDLAYPWLDLTPPHKADMDIAIRQSAHQYNIDECLIAAMVMKETTFNPLNHNGSGYGPMQLEPRCCAEMGVAYPCLDIYININAGTRYFKRQLDKFGDTRLALAAYNAGPSKVSYLMKKHGSRYENIEGRLPAITQAHVKNVINFYNEFKKNEV